MEERKTSKLITSKYKLTEDKQWWQSLLSEAIPQEAKRCTPKLAVFLKLSSFFRRTREQLLFMLSQINRCPTKPWTSKEISLITSRWFKLASSTPRPTWSVEEITRHYQTQCSSAGSSCFRALQIIPSNLKKRKKWSLQDMAIAVAQLLIGILWSRDPERK